MNTFFGHISNIHTNGSLSIVSVAINEQVTLKAIVVENPDTVDYLVVTAPVQLLFKETEVLIALSDSITISIQNKIQGTISTIEKGVLLSKLYIATAIGEVVSVITTQSIENLALSIGKQVTAMIQINEIMLAK